MNSAKHTPGPWVWSGLQLLAVRCDHTDPVMIADDPPFDPSDPDKSLIAAAPDLLEALRKAEAHIDRVSGGGETDLRAELNAAISKAMESSP